MEVAGGVFLGFLAGWVWGGTLCNLAWWQWFADELQTGRLIQAEDVPKKKHH